MIERPAGAGAWRSSRNRNWITSCAFLNFEFHFVRDASGGVTRLEIGHDRKIRADAFSPGNKETAPWTEKNS